MGVKKQKQKKSKKKGNKNKNKGKIGKAMEKIWGFQGFYGSLQLWPGKA